jgi:hypothetical protein
MSNITSKPRSDQDSEGAIRSAYNDVDATISTNGFLVGKVGHKITMAVSTTSIASDTETYTFLDGSTTLYVFKIIYTDGTRATMMSAERTA